MKWDTCTVNVIAMAAVALGIPSAAKTALTKAVEVTEITHHQVRCRLEALPIRTE
jgi:hypothetical protein